MRAVRGSCVASSGASRAREGSRRWPAGGEVARARAGERRAHALVLLSEEEDDREGAGGLGRPGGGSWAGWWAARVRPGRLHSFYFFSSLFCFNSVFYFAGLF